jgi:hypothetical protein
VEWSGVSHYNSSGTPTSPETFQVILNEDGTIVYQYQTVALGTGCTVGIENAAGTVGLQVVFNGSYLHNSLAVRFARQTPWMTVTPLSGTVLPQGSAMLTVSFDAGDLAEGVYTGVIGVSSNDPYDPVLEVPVTFTVGGPPDPVDDLTIVPSGDHVRLSWSAALLAAGYRVYRMTDVSQPYTAGELLTPIPITDTTYLDMFRPIGMNFYQVVAVR